MDKSSVEPTIFFIEKISFSLKLFSGHFYGQSFIKTVRGPLQLELYRNAVHVNVIVAQPMLQLFVLMAWLTCSTTSFRNFIKCPFRVPITD